MISVVIPCYNGVATVRATIESALVQDAPHEIIVVNDGSTDASADVLASFGDRIRAVTTPNCGASAARTTGTEMARGDFIQYLDSDDLLMPGTLLARVRALEAIAVDVAHTDWQKFSVDDRGNILPGEIMRPNLMAIERDAEMATATSEFWAPPAALLYRRGIVARIGPWHSGLPIIQDARFLYDAASHGARFVHVPGIGAQYRVAPSSLSRKNHRGFIADCAVNAQEIETAWRQRGALSEARSKALAGVWAQVATSALLHGLDEFEPARRGYNRSARRRLLFEAGCLARVAIGAARAATLARGLLQLKASAHSIIRLFGTQ